ncbi:FliH/SctL family protein [Planctomicrobium sp. SH661]|uniref:FliH/SctL family protein n=1 Tax=Planctomicrobium sp. SH661 TaxID=3448124 RepID=UPI003F5C88E7
MHRQQIFWSDIPVDVRLRGCTNSIERPAPPAPQRPVPAPVAASFPNESGQPVTTAPPPPPDIRPLLESIAASLDVLDQRRQQSLGELQQVALELAISVASHLVFEAISQDQFGVEKLVEQAISAMGIDSAPVVSLHPKDLELLQRRLAQQPAPWRADQVSLRADPGVARGGCRVENDAGRMQVSDISLRLSEIRRHWMEELDDTQIERRRSQVEGQSLRRFPDRRETA